LCTPLEIEERISYQEGIDSPNHKEWMVAIRNEIDSMVINRVWELVNLPPQRKSIKSKWVFKIKRWEHGLIDKFKTHLVVKGSTKIEGVDYEETFSPMVRFASFAYS